MKKIFLILTVAGLAAVQTACELDKYPDMAYTEHNASGDGSSDEQAQYTTRADIKGQLDAMYSNLKGDIQEPGYSDWLIYTECRCDNAYAGSVTTGEIMDIESNKQDGDNKNVSRDWPYYLNRVSDANQVIYYIDKITDPALTDTERREWKSEALCWRAFNWFNMTRLWGKIPMIKIIPPTITADNIEETYPLYYPARNTVEEVYDQIIEDLTYACDNAPAVDPTNKFKFTKGFACGLLARVYAEKPRQDYQKVATLCARVEGMGYSLVDNYGDLWGYTTEDVNRNTSESIFEVQWTKSSGNWVWMMFHRNAYSPDDSFSWSKWVTPSRNLIAAYDAEGDTERKNASLVFDSCTWSSYYPSDNYAFMNKCPTNASSYILMRLGEIYLLHAEALANQGLLHDANLYVTKVRTRAGLTALPASVEASKQTMLDAILKERRLELAFEGQRWFDLVRYGKAKEVCDGANVVGSASYDPKVSTRRPMTDNSILLPVPTNVLDNNSNIQQNPGY